MVFMRRYRVLKSITKELPKRLFISITQKIAHASFGNQSILNFRDVVLHDIVTITSVDKYICLSRGFLPFKKFKKWLKCYVFLFASRDDKWEVPDV